MVRLEEISKSYQYGRNRLEVLVNVSLVLNKGDFVSISGPSGSGKTTLLNLIGCIDSPTSGRVVIDGRDVRRLSDAQLAALRNRVMGFIFQSFNLIPVLTAYENAEYPLRLLRVPRQERRERVRGLLHEVGLGDHMAYVPDKLSGGQRQRVAIARALAAQPMLVLADEPTGNLDANTSREIMDLLARLNEDHKTTFIFATHDPNVTAYAKRSFRLTGGRLES